ncbi:MAG: ribonuclease H-like domain-containing protein [Deltaproteobacteria bacterium]|nr:ribonuclease H-like domain-containing protein [Deltaproteobacteria bacterium]
MPTRPPIWVSKTDLTRYLRCPYAFYLLDRGLIAFEETVTEMQIRLIQEGVEFHSVVEAKAIPLSIEPNDLPRVFAEESIRLFGVPLFENAKLQIYGKPDAIDTAQGALIPIEIKSHKAVQRSDELELAFYWMLLEPLRKRKVPPRGYLLLRRDGVDEQVEVEIPSHRLDQVLDLLQDIRKARDLGVTPRICGCTVCSGIMREEIDRATRAKKDLTRLWGMGRVYARHFEDIGISDYDELLSVESSSLVEKLRDRKCFVSPAQVDHWKHHAASYSASSPVLFGNPLRLDGGFLALDLEYVPSGLIWLVGICLVRPNGREYFALWAETSIQEKRNLKRLAEISMANPSLPVVTWSGNGADMPQLRNAAQRLKLGHELDAVTSKHLDLFQYVRNAVRFPIPQLIAVCEWMRPFFLGARPSRSLFLRAGRPRPRVARK